MILAETDGQLVGAAVVLLRADSADARLYSIAVAGPARGRGVGRVLLGACEAAAMAAGRTGLRLEVRESNAQALALYRVSGYEVTGRIGAYYADGEDALRLRRALFREREKT